MWQRIQTLWLLLVALAMGVFAFQDIAIFTMDEGTYCLLNNWGIYNGADGLIQHRVYAIGILSWLSCLGALGLSLFGCCFLGRLACSFLGPTLLLELLGRGALLVACRRCLGSCGLLRSLRGFLSGLCGG